MNKILATTIGSAAIVGGALFGASALSGVAGAESSVDEPAAVETGFVPVQDEVETPDTDGEREGCEGRGHHGHHGGRDLGVVAEAIGIETDELRAGMAEGQTIREIAEANGVDADSVADAVVTAKQERLAEKVAAGELTQAEADEKLADAGERAEALLDKVPGERGGDNADTDASA